ncbi:MAG: LysM peptidoglycan-binding domain-containing protein [Methylococcaceae bacterium]
MTFHKTLGLLIALLFNANIWADTLKINPDHPNQYTVVKDDTLWDISGKFLQHPWQWPQLWGNNPQIKNPHLIYPGNTLYFSIVDGKPRLSLSDHSSLKPRIRESSLEQAIKLIPTDAIAQFLTSPKVVDEKELAQSPYVIDFAGEHLIAGAGDKIYVRSIPTPESLSYTIYREGETYINPKTGEILGYEAKYIADTTIEKSGDPATLTIIKSDSEIRRGDRLMASTENKLALTYFPHPPNQIISGNIISVLDGVSQIGQHNIVVIDKGTVDGLTSGHTLDIYQRGKVVADPFSELKDAAVKLPDEIAGVLMVFRSFKRVSYALVITASKSIHILDRVQTP